MAKDSENSTVDAKDSGERDTSAGQGDEKLLADAKLRLKLVEDAEVDERRDALDDLNFCKGDQWPDDIKAERDRDRRPCLVINRMPQFIQQVTNDQRQNRPALKIHPVDDDADVETAKIRQGLIRHIEYNSNADVAYDTGFESAARAGKGFWRIITEYADPTSFDQEILVKRIRNPFSVFFDPYSQEPDGSDANYAFVVEELSKEEFEARYPKAKASGGTDAWNMMGNSAPGWMRDGKCRVAEYFYREWKEETIVLLADGQSMPKEKLSEYAEYLAKTVPEGTQAQPIQIVNERVARVPSIKWCKLNGDEVLERRDWPGKYIPIVPVYGTEIYIDGKRTLSGIIRNAKDSQRMYNYWASAETEAIALAPRTPFIVAAAQIKGFEQFWTTANSKNHAYLPYHAADVKGTLIGPPQRNQFEPAVQAITQARMLASDDLKSTTGIYDAALGNKSNENSGIAIQRRNVQSQTSNYHFIDNLTRSLKHSGRIIDDLLQYIYDSARTARIIGEDGEQKVVKVNQPFEQDGKPVHYDLTKGKYDTTIDVGPSFASRRQEAAASMLDLAKSVPGIGQVAPDLIVKAMDWEGAKEISERLKRTVPPNLLSDQQPGGPGGQIPPQIQQQLQQQSQMIEQLTAQVHGAAQDLETKRLEIESRERIEYRKLDVQLALKQAELDAKDSHAILDHEVESIHRRIEKLHEDSPIIVDDHAGTPDLTGTNGAFSAGAAPSQPPTGGASPGSLPPEGSQ